MPVPKHVFTFETAAQLEPGTIMCVNRAVGTEVLLHHRLLRDAKVITREARRSTTMAPITHTPVWKSAEANVVISTNSLCMITALTIQEGVGVHADLVCFERSGERYNAVLLEAVDLDHGINYWQFFDKSKFVFNLNRVYESIEKVNMFQNICLWHIQCSVHFYLHHRSTNDVTDSYSYIQATLHLVRDASSTHKSPVHQYNTRRITKHSCVRNRNTSHCARECKHRK